MFTVCFGVDAFIILMFSLFREETKEFKQLYTVILRPTYLPGDRYLQSMKN